jgi:thiosulfate/3-mercaptopyruvate sulfurtransferase
MDIKIDAIIDSHEVRQRLDRKDVVIVDARGGADSLHRYQAAHLQNAIYMDLDRDLSEKSADPAKGGRHPLPAPAAVGSLLGRAGITPTDHVLVYDDKSGANAAARFWWMMKAAGHARVQVVNGGFDSLVQEGLPIATGQVVPAKPRDPYPIKGWNLTLADIHTVDKLRHNPDYIVIDVREGYRYRGESEPIDLVAGHIPGAVNLPYLENLGASGRFRSAEELADQYHALIGARDGNHVIVHCGSGVTACHTLLALEVAGIPGASLYVGSWSEWSRNEKPIAQGQNP